MARNGIGAYSLYTPGNPVVGGTVIEPAWANNTLQDIATALTGSVAANGETPVTGNIAMTGNKFTGMGTGSATTDSLNLAQAQGETYQLLGSVAGTDTITAVGTPTVPVYAAGHTYRLIVANTNTGAVTINIDSRGAVAVTKNGTTALVAGDLVAGALVQITYDGTRFQVTGVMLNSALFQPVDAGLTSLALLPTAADKLAYATAANVWAETALTAFIRTLLDDVDQATARATLGLGATNGKVLQVQTHVVTAQSTVTADVTDSDTAITTSNTEELLTKTIIPLSATSTFHVKWNVMGSSTTRRAVAALFDSTIHATNAVRASGTDINPNTSSGAYVNPIHGMYSAASVSTADRTFSVRVGCVGSGTVHINVSDDGTKDWGGTSVLACTLEIMEVEA